MYLYSLTIDGEKYEALFLDHFEASDFLDENDRDGSIVIVENIEGLSPRKALQYFNYSPYAIELVFEYLYPNEINKFKKVDELKDFLKINEPLLF